MDRPVSRIKGFGWSKVPSHGKRRRTSIAQSCKGLRSRCNKTAWARPVTTSRIFQSTHFASFFWNSNGLWDLLVAIGLSLYFHFAASESKDSTIGRRGFFDTIPFIYLQRRPLGCSKKSLMRDLHRSNFLPHLLWHSRKLQLLSKLRLKAWFRSSQSHPHPLITLMKFHRSSWRLAVHQSIVRLQPNREVLISGFPVR